MNRQQAKPSAGDSNEAASPLSLLVHAADAQNTRPSSKRGSNGSGSRGNGMTRRDLHESALEEQMIQRQVAAARAEAAYHQGLLPHLPRGVEAEIYQQAAAAQQQQQQAAAMAIASDLRTAVAAAQLRQAAQFQNHDLLLARAAQQQLGGLGTGGLDQLQELELQRLEELERRHLLAQAASGHAPPRPSLAARQLEMQEAQLRKVEQLERLQQDALLDRVGGGQMRSVAADNSTGAGSENITDSFQKTPGSVVVPCRARGMPMDHNFKTAYFVIPENVEHGEELICSYFACRNAGIKFRYCTYCKVPVAKRNFRKRHKHGANSTADADDDSHSGDEVAPAVASKESKVDNGELAVPETSDNAAVDVAVPVSANEPGSKDVLPSDKATQDKQKTEEMDGKNTSSKVPTSGDPISSKRGGDEAEGTPLDGRIDAEREHRWATLLVARPPTKDEGAMSGWLMEVLAVSDLDTPLAVKASGPPESSTSKSHTETEDTKSSKASSNKVHEEKSAALPSQGVLVKKKRPLGVVMHDNDDIGDGVDASGAPPEGEGGGFAEWKDRKKQKGLIKKGLTG